MKFPIAALLCICICFIFAVIWLVMTFLLETVSDALVPLAPTITDAADRAMFLTQLSHIQMGFGVVSVLFLVVGIILFFVLQSWSDEPEYYYQE